MKFDDDEKKYTVDILQKMKVQHEQEIIEGLENSINNVTCEELSLILKFLSKSCTQNVTSDDFSVIPPKEKISKNNLSPIVANRITMGLAIYPLIKDYINKQSNIDFSFSQNLKNCFIGKYLELKEQGMDSDTTFAKLWDFAKNGKIDNNSIAAALSVISYFFLECDIFEK